MAASGQIMSAEDLLDFQKGNNPETRTCKNCGKVGHVQANYRTKGGGAYNSSGGKSDDKPQTMKTCVNCGKPGHPRMDFWSKPRGGDCRPGGKDGKNKGGKSPKGDKGKGSSVASLEKADGDQWNADNTSELYSFDKVSDRYTSAPSSLPSPRILPWQRELNSMDENGKTWTKFHFDAGAAETAFPNEMFTDELGNRGVTYKTASGERVTGYGSGHLGDADENTKYRKLGSEFTDDHEILASAGAVHNKGHLSWSEAGGDYVIPVDSEIGK